MFGFEPDQVHDGITVRIHAHPHLCAPGVAAVDSRMIEDENWLRFRSLDTSTTLWDAQLIIFPTKIYIQRHGVRYAQWRVQELYGDVILSIVAGEMNYSQPRMYLPKLDLYTDLEITLFKRVNADANAEPFEEAPAWWNFTTEEQGLFAQDATISSAGLLGTGKWIWACAHTVDLPYVCSKIDWCPHIDPYAEPVEDMSGVGTIHETTIAGYVPVDDVHWLRRQLAARRNQEIMLRREIARRDEAQGAKKEDA